MTYTQQFLNEITDVTDSINKIKDVILKLSPSLLQQISDVSQDRKVLDNLEDFYSDLIFFSEDLGYGEFLVELCEDTLLSIEELLKEEEDT